MSGFMKTVLKTTKIAGMFLGNQSDSVNKYGHVVLRVLSTLCTLKGSYSIPCLCKPLKSLQMSRTSQTKLN